MDSILEEYVNDLDARGTLEDAIALLSPDGRQQLTEAVDAADRRFYAATRPIENAVWPGVGWKWKPQRWWYYRVPKSMTPGFEQTYGGVSGLMRCPADLAAGGQ